MKLLQQFCAVVLSCLVVQGLILAQAQTTGSTSPPKTTEELHQLVAPIALYPDALVAQVLAGSTYPAEVVEANDWLQNHPNWKGKKLAKEANKQSWDPSIKALTQFRSVLQNMDKNLAWTSELGEAFAHQPKDVNAAVQFMRQQAQKAGNLTSNSQQAVTTKDQNIVIQPASPSVVYVPAYNPWVVYGYPVVPYPGWVPVPGIWWGGPSIVFGASFGVGYWGGYGWGWPHWGYYWPGQTIIFNNNTYISNSHTFNNYALTGGGFAPSSRFTPVSPNHGGGFSPTPSWNRSGFSGNSGFTQRSSWGGLRSNAFSGFNHGGFAQGFAAQGRSSFGGAFGGGGFGGFRR